MKWALVLKAWHSGKQENQDEAHRTQFQSIARAHLPSTSRAQRH